MLGLFNLFDITTFFVIIFLIIYILIYTNFNLIETSDKIK